MMGFLQRRVFTLDNLWHSLGGTALAAPILLLGGDGFGVAGVWVLWGFLREQAQDKENGWVAWIKPHKLLEGASWGVGPLVWGVVWLFV